MPLNVAFLDGGTWTKGAAITMLPYPDSEDQFVVLTAARPSTLVGVTQLAVLDSAQLILLDVAFVEGIPVGEPFWVYPGTAVRGNPKLVSFLDPLYQHIKGVLE